MSKLEELIQELCPNGVEYKTIGEVCDITRGKVMSKDFIRDNEGDYPVYSSQTENNGELGKISTYMFDGEYISWTTDGANAGTVFYRTGKFSITNVCGLLKIKVENLNCKFLYYFLTTATQPYVNKGMGNAKLMSNVMASIKVPLPPLKVQSEIVRILDNFTLLTAELTAELTARKQQYEYYRDALLTFDSNIPKFKLKDIAQIYDGTHQTPEYKSEGIPFISVENINDIYNSKKYISVEAYEKYKIKPQINDVFMTRIGSIGKCAVFDKKADIAYYVSLALIRPNINIVNSKYLKFIIESGIGEKELRKRTLIHAVPIKINKESIGDIVLPIPNLQIQERLINVLENFEKICSDLNIGLPAEIEARQQQYEFYRAKLLTMLSEGVNLSKQASKQAR